MLHRTRHLLITASNLSVINVIRAHLAELGIVRRRRKGVEELLDVIADRSDKRVPEIARTCLHRSRPAQLRVAKSSRSLEFDRIIYGLAPI